MKKISVNKATSEELRQIVGIGFKKSQLIIVNRPYKDVYEISKLKGFGRKRIESFIQQGLNC